MSGAMGRLPPVLKLKASVVTRPWSRAVGGGRQYASVALFGRRRAARQAARIISGESVC